MSTNIELISARMRIVNYEGSLDRLWNMQFFIGIGTEGAMEVF